MIHDGLIEHVMFFFGGATGLGIIAHAVSTFPTPINAYGKWLLGVVQYIVGQRVQANQTLKGEANAGSIVTNGK